MHESASAACVIPNHMHPSNLWANEGAGPCDYTICVDFCGHFGLYWILLLDTPLQPSWMVASGVVAPWVIISTIDTAWVIVSSIVTAWVIVSGIVTACSARAG